MASLNFDVRFERCNLSYGLFGAMNLKTCNAWIQSARKPISPRPIGAHASPGLPPRRNLRVHPPEGADLSRATDDAIDPRENAVAGAQFSAAAVRLATFRHHGPPGT